MGEPEMIAEQPIEPSNYDMAGIPDAVYEWIKWHEAEVSTLRAELDAARGRVKPLAWSLTPNGVWQTDAGAAGSYMAADSQWWHTGLGAWVWVDGGTEAAKSAAQADYTARILAALEPDPAVVRMREALNSIAANTCCVGCQEAAHVARAAIQGE